MSRRKRNSPTTSASIQDVPQAGGDSTGGAGTNVSGPFLFVTSVLLVTRYFLPAESAALGETLWVVQLWLIAAVFWLWMAARSGWRLRRFDLLDLGLGLLIGGHVLSAAVILVTDGDRRAALNMLWEWIGIGVAALMIREAARTPNGRFQLTSLVVISAITLSVLGLWQHHAWYPSLTGKLAELDRLSSAVPAGPIEAADRRERLRDLRRDLGPLGANDDPTATQLLRARVAASTEPIGRFALANTFAGLLLVVLLLAIGRLGQKWRTTPSDWRWSAGGAMTLLVAYCFWLTKSRTATVGLLVALAAWSVSSWKAIHNHARGRWVLTAVALLLLGIPVIAGLTGGLDREVITEAPKSLQYRLEYWTATGAVIGDAPILGVGPGNFRQAYLRHKLPGSSEEVLDPHNLVLDVWANGGLLALAGLGTLIASLLLRAGRPEPDISVTIAHQPPAARWSEIAVRCAVGVIALGLVAFVELFNGVGFSVGGWWLIAVWCAVCVIWPPDDSRGVGTNVAGIALLAVGVHLLGAGGIAMPAILQTLVLLAACTIPEQHVISHAERVPARESTSLPWQPMTGAAVCLCLGIACAFTATLPVSAARTQVQLGKAAIAEGNLPMALAAFEQAIEADPLSAEPWQELAIAHALDWQRLAGTDDDAFQRAIEAQSESIRLDPHAPGGWQLLGDLWWQRFERQRDRDPRAAEEAVVAYREATARYPNQAEMQSKLARAAAAAGEADSAVRAAERALMLEEANRAQGHSDKFLSESAREAVESIATGDGEGL